MILLFRNVFIIVIIIIIILAIMVKMKIRTFTIFSLIHLVAGLGCSQRFGADYILGNFWLVKGTFGCLLNGFGWFRMISGGFG